MHMLPVFSWLYKTVAHQTRIVVVIAAKAGFGVNGGDMTLGAGNGMLSGGDIKMLQVREIQTWAEHYF